MTKDQIELLRPGFEAVTAERDQLKTAMRQIAETAIKVGDV